jgi:hypothetical protein
MGKTLLIKITMGKPPNEMDNCPFASPLVTPLVSCETHNLRKERSFESANNSLCSTLL